METIFSQLPLDLCPVFLAGSSPGVGITLLEKSVLAQTLLRLNPSREHGHRNDYNDWAEYLDRKHGSAHYVEELYVGFLGVAFSGDHCPERHDVLDPVLARRPRLFLGYPQFMSVQKR